MISSPLRDAHVGLAFLVALIACPLAVSTADRCGVATNLLDGNDASMNTFCGVGLGFWWNWNVAPRRSYSAACAEQTFVPMIWGFASENPDNARKAGVYKHFMGYNEPDHWAPAPKPGGDVLSAGTFTVNFHCASDGLAENWMQSVMAYLQANPSGVILTPAMADATGNASVGDYSACGAAIQDEVSHDLDDCAGWLKCFKESVMRFNCGSTNCWDVIQGIQFHAYFYTAQDLIRKVQMWEHAWADDLAGVNGRTKKKLWLTEWAHAGTIDAADPDGAASKFMEDSINFLASNPHVAGWSWFSQTNFASFPIGGQEPSSPTWTSELFNPVSGALTALGQKYTSLCSALPPAPPAATPAPQSLVV